MEEQQKSIDEIFRQSLGDYREAPPAAAWDTVAGRLDNDDGSRRRGYFMRWPWISLLLLLLIGGGWFIAAKYGGGPAVKDGRLSTAPVTTITEKASVSASSSLPDTTVAGPGTTTGINAAASRIPAETATDKRAIPAGQKTPRRKTAAVKAAHITAGRGRTHHTAVRTPAQAAGHNVLSPSASSTITDKESATGSSAPDTAATAGLRSAKKSSSGRRPIAGTKAGQRSVTAGTATDAGSKNAGMKSGGTAQQPATPAGQAEAAKTQDTEPAIADQDAANKLRRQQSAASRRQAKEERYAARARAAQKAASLKGQAIEQQPTNRTAKAPATNKPSATNAQAAGDPAPDNTAAAPGTAKPASVKRSTAARQPVAAASKSTVSKRRPSATKEQVPEDSSVVAVVKPLRPKKTVPVKAPRVKSELSTEAANEPGAEVATAVQATPANKRSSTKAEKAAIAKRSAAVTEEAVQTQALPQPVKDPVVKKSRPANEPAAQKRSVAKSARTPQRTQPGEEEAGQGNALKSTAANPPEHVFAAKGIQPSRQGQSTPAAKRSPATKQPAVAKESPAASQALPRAAKPARPSKQIPAIAKNTAPAKPSAATENPDPASPAEFVPPPVQTFTFSPTLPKAATADATGREEAGTDEAEDGATGGGGGGGGASPAPERKRTSFISLAALAGYEVALQTPAPNMITGGLRLLWHFDPGIAVGVQPAFRYGNVTMTSLSSSNAYQQRAPIQVDSLRRFDTTGSVIYRSYSLRQSIDSVIISGVSAGGPFWQLELPIILSYKIAQAWHLYGGASVNFSGKLSTTAGGRQTYTTVLFDSVRASGGAVLPARPASSFENYFPTSSSLPDISTYKQEENVLKDAASVRFGYVFGLGYEWKRIIFDASIHQQVSGYSNVNQPVQHVYSSPNVRLSLGFFLIPPKSVRKTGAE